MQIKEILNLKPEGQEVIVKGWVKTKRGQSTIAFINLNDGSTIKNIQVVAESDKVDENKYKNLSTGAAIRVTGKLVASSGAGQTVEVHAEDIHTYGLADETFPIQPKKHSLEFLREKAHLRFRTNLFGAIFRIRHALAFAIHKYYNDRGFFYLHSPIITASDAEGAGEMFRVTTFEPNKAPLTKDGEVDFAKDFFGREASLTVSGQLEAELGALALSKVYTFGPTFRAENSNTTRHLAEFWMIEPEVAFNDIEDNMNLAEDFVKYVIKYVLENCQDDLEFLDKRQANEDKQKPKNERSDLGLIEKLNFVVDNAFERLTYTKAIEILENSNYAKKKRFEYEVSWGIDLHSEHERYLVERHFKKPVIVTDYPKEIKAFYMKLNEDGKTVRAMDVLFPGIGEIIGGSEREEDYDTLLGKIREGRIDEENLWWYLETRKYGTVPHSGFGLGFERLVLFVTGMTNIRDVIPFPRTPKSAEF